MVPGNVTAQGPDHTVFVCIFTSPYLSVVYCEGDGMGGKERQGCSSSCPLAPPNSSVRRAEGSQGWCKEAASRSDVKAPELIFCIVATVAVRRNKYTEYKLLVQFQRFCMSQMLFCLHLNWDCLV